MARKLSPGVHMVRIKGQGMRKVRVKKNGQWRFMKGTKKSSSSKKTKSKSRSKSKGGNKRTANKSGFSIPSLPSLAKAGVAISWLAFRQTGHGVPAYEFQVKNIPGAVMGILQNAADVIMTMDGWMKVIAPIALISIVQKMVPRAQINVMGMRWRIL